MEFVTPTLKDVPWLAAAVVLFLLPGWVLARRLAATPVTLSAFLASAAMLFNVALLLHVIGWPLHAGTIAPALAGLAAFCWLIPQQSPARTPAPASMARWDLLWLVAPALALLSIIARAAIDPLSGYDNLFRWDYLARLIRFRESFAGYPPVSAADFELYAWCDGIPPLVPLLNFWIYAITGSVAPSLTVARVVGEALLLRGVVYRYGELLWDRRGGLIAAAALSTSALAVWGVAMGQETGLTAIALVAMLYFLELHFRDRSLRPVFWAAIAAAVGALARDYTTVFPLLGLLVLVGRRAELRAIALFTLTTAALAAPWYLRNWTITGNPLYPHTLGGIFPGNAVHDEYMRYVAEYWTPFGGPLNPSWIPLVLAALAGALIVGGSIGIARASRLRWPGLLSIAVVVVLWAVSLPQTAGGWIYASRVLLPALGVLAAFSGWCASAGRHVRVLVLVGVTLASVDAARRAWFLPADAFASPWSLSFDSWRTSRAGVNRIIGAGIWSSLVQKAQGAGIVVDHPAYHAVLTVQGATAVPLFSPALRPAFNDDVAFDAVLTQLREANIRFLALSRGSPMTERLLSAHPFWDTLRDRYQPIVKVGVLWVYDLQQPPSEP